MDNAVDQLKGKPLLMEHRGSAVGSVLSAWKADDGRLMVMAETEDNKLAGKFTNEMVKSGGWGDFSLCSSAPFDITKMEFGPKSFIEVSVVHEGLRPGTNIHGYAPKTTSGQYKNSRDEPSTEEGCTVFECRASRNAMATAADPVPDSGDAKPPQNQDEELLRRIAALEAENTNLKNSIASDAPPSEPAGTSAADANAAGAGVDQWMKDALASKYKAAYTEAVRQYLSGLKVDDPSQRDRLVSQLGQFADNPAIGGEGANKMMDLVLACHANNQAQMDKFESSLQELKTAKQDLQNAQQQLSAYKQNETQREAKRAKQDLTNEQSRIVPKNATGQLPAEAQSSQSNSAPPTKFNETFEWLSSGYGNGQGMDRVTVPKGRGGN